MNTLPIARAHQLEATRPEHEWLIESLWGADAVGTIGGEPKCCKSLLSLYMAVSVASGCPCLGRFPVKRQGPVLLFAAEDALSVVRTRLDAICVHCGVSLSELSIWVITAPSVRLDQVEDCRRLLNTVAEIKPALLILDPFVRLHRVDENVSAAVVPLLDFLRRIQRQHGCAVALVHHARKGAGNARAGQALRGSSEFHAWADSSLFLRRTGGRPRLSTEHRAQPSTDNIPLDLITTSSAPVLVADLSTLASSPPSIHTPSSDRERVILALRSIDRPASIRELRPRCRMRTNTLCDILNELAASGSVLKSTEGWSLPSPPRADLAAQHA